MRRASLLLVFAAGMAAAVPVVPEALARPAGVVPSGPRAASPAVRRVHLAPVAHRPAHGRFGHRPGFRHRPVYGYGFGGWPLYGWPAYGPWGAAEPAAFADPVAAPTPTVPTVVGIPRPPVAPPVVYVIETRPPARVHRPRPGYGAGAHSKAVDGPRIIHVTLPRRR